MTDHIVSKAQAVLPNIPLNVVSQGAEALVFQTSVHPYCSKPAGFKHQDSFVIKYRPNKPYRHPKIDKQITRNRTVAEAKFMSKLTKLAIPAPRLIAVDPSHGVIWMEFVGETLTNGNVSSLKNWLWSLEKQENSAEVCVGQDVERVFNNIGGLIAKLHMNEMIHGDLTSSNIMLERVEEEYKAVLIDFGLSSYSGLPEDKAVDLYVLERAVLSTHSVHSDLYNDWLLKGYSDMHHSKEFKSKQGTKKLVETIKRLEDVRLRGRKRSMLG
ncbi:EKC/KEOPS complex subunit Bud32p [[Candida] anglica]|uniref:EKC/KEOPS complex subunit BUD32 n=1 Tax=[Candida] anglica TaxID=148631 RepID=A0ABP0EP73_9ASCO